MFLHDPNLSKPEIENCICPNFFGTLLVLDDDVDHDLDVDHDPESRDDLDDDLDHNSAGILRLTM